MTIYKLLTLMSDILIYVLGVVIVLGFLFALFTWSTLPLIAAILLSIPIMIAAHICLDFTDSTRDR